MYVAITKITEIGQPVFCVNPVETTTDFNLAFKFYDKREAELSLKEAKEIYKLDAIPFEIIKQEQEQKRESEQQELQEAI